jgi:hypothetical protein
MQGGSAFYLAKSGLPGVNTHTTLCKYARNPPNTPNVTVSHDHPEFLPNVYPLTESTTLKGLRRSRGCGELRCKIVGNSGDRRGMEHTSIRWEAGSFISVRTFFSTTSNLSKFSDPDMYPRTPPSANCSLDFCTFPPIHIADF